MVTTSKRRDVVTYFREAFAMSERRACRVIESPRSTQRYMGRPRDTSLLLEELRELAQKRPRFGYRRLHALLRRRPSRLVRKRLRARDSTKPFAGLHPTLDYYVSSIHCQIGGIKVEESYAWARFNSAGNVVAEAVYWPEMPSSVVDDAASFSAMLADPKAGTTFLAKIPKGIEGRLAIHHTPAIWRGGFEQVVCYDVHVGAGEVQHFASDATKLQLPVDRETNAHMSDFASKR